MSDFEYEKLIEQILNQKDQQTREELFGFIGENGDDRFINPLIELIELDDSPTMRQSIYTTLVKIGTDLADTTIEKEIRTKLPQDDGEKITAKSWDEAVNFLMKNMESSFIKKAQSLIESEGNLWGYKNKGGIGIYIRNLLRNNGFNWGESALSSYWPWVVEDAISRLNKTD